MPIGVAMVDRARSIARQQLTPVGGYATTSEVRSEWFRCRLIPGRGSEGRLGARNAVDSQSGVSRVVHGDHMLFDIEDEAGAPVRLNAEMRVEIDSEQLGRHVFLVGSDPQPVRKRRSVIAWEVPIRRIEENPGSLGAVL